MKLVFATRNPNKVQEVRSVLFDAGLDLELLSLDDINCKVELPETTGTIPGNAIQKAQYIWDHFNINVFSEDTGLEIEALEGRPGVDTAYYAGPERDAKRNMQKVLDELADRQNRKAQFRTVIALYIDGHLQTFEGIVKGQIAKEMRGKQGFGYDPIFIPEDHSQTFAELPSTTKKEISHRARAVRKLIIGLKEKLVP